MRTYQKLYSGRFARYLVYHGVEESWYRELSQICYSASVYMSLCLSLCARENQALQIALLFAVHKLLRFRGSRVKKGGSVHVFVHTRVNGFTCRTNCSRSASRILDRQIVHTHKFEDKLALSSAEKKIHSHHPLCARRSYNKLQKYLRHCTLFWLKCPGHELVPVIPLLVSSKLSAIQDNAHN